MKFRTTLLIGITVFVAVLCALRLDRVLGTARNRQSAPGPLMMPAPKVETAFYDPDPAEGTLDFRVAAKKVIPSVVSVERYERVVDFFGYQTNQIQETASGSGVIIGADGLIVTNNHVVADENGYAVPQVKVKLHDGRAFTAKVIGTDARADLAVLRIDGSNLVPAEIGHSASLQVGQWVMAVGNPLGFDDTVTVGVVSSLKRDLPIGQHGLTNAIQTDASINPGNSGGALCDQHGNLVGINSAIASSNGGSVGIGFAIPVDRVRAVVNDIVKFGHVRYASLGIGFYPNAEGALADERARQYIADQTGASADSVPKTGLIVGNAAGPAGQAGLGQWDILLSLDGVPVDTIFSVNRLLGEKKPFEHATIKWWSKGQTKTATVTLQESGGRTQ
jgi:serine protease Do